METSTIIIGIVALAGGAYAGIYLYKRRVQKSIMMLRLFLKDNELTSEFLVAALAINGINIGGTTGFSESFDVVKDEEKAEAKKNSAVNRKLEEEASLPSGSLGSADMIASV